jgi:hypothetical protein
MLPAPLFFPLSLFFHSSGFELRALNLLGRHSTTLAMPLAFFALVIFELGPHVYAQLGLDNYPPIYTSHVWNLCLV